MAIDPKKEVQQFGPYQLVIRQKDGKVHAVLWKGSERLCNVETDDPEQAVEEVLLQMGMRTLERARIRGTAAPGADELRHAFEALWNELNDGQRAMLGALHRAPGRELGTLDLAAAAGYKGHGGVSLWLGFAGLMFGEMVARADLQMTKKGQAVLTSWFCTWDTDRRAWTMRPDVAAGITAAGCLA
jgi:hypothetical protein